MRVLIAEDDPVSRRVLEAMLRKWEHDVIVTTDGIQAWEKLQREDAPKLAILDWMMPGMDGVEVCRRAREASGKQPTYIILLTARDQSENIVAGLQAGADDYVVKPFDREELRARVQAGVRIVELQSSLADRVRELEDALSQIKQLRGMLPICSYCKKIRNDEDYWERVEDYIGDHLEAQFTHGICPDCYEKIVEPEIEKELQRGTGK